MFLKNTIRRHAVCYEQIHVYVDDFEHIGRTKDDCVKCRQILRSVARQAGWLCREQEPSTCIRFRGYNLNTASMKFEVTKDKLKLVLKKVIVLLEAKAKRSCSPRSWATRSTGCTRTRTATEVPQVKRRPPLMIGAYT